MESDRWLPNHRPCSQIEAKDPVKGDYFLREVIDATEPVAAGARTEAQKIVYKDGIPVLQATPTSTADELVSFREEVRNILRGAKEEARLSNPDILADEIRAGSLPFKQAADGTVEVFTTTNIPRLRNGERVSLSEELAADILGGTARSFTANVDDLVRLPDGTFAYAPKKFINDSAEPTIKMIALEKQKAVETIEKTAKDTARKQKATQVALEKSKRLADEQEAARLAKEDAARVARETTQKVEAQKTLKETPMQLAQRKADVDIEVAKDLARIKSVETVAKAAVKSSMDNVRTAIGGVKTAMKKVKVAQKALAKAKKEGRATVRISQALAKAKADLKAANAARRAADNELSKAKKSVPTDTKVKMTEAKAKADIRKAELLKESRKTVAEAKATLREIESATKTSAPNARQAERLQAKVDKLEGKKAKLIEAYGGIDEVPEGKLKEIDDAIAELGEVSTPVAKVGGDSAAVTKVAVKETTVTPTAKIKPVKIEGTDTNTSTLMTKLGKDLKDVGDLPGFNVATHAKQTENALNHIAKNGIDETLSLIERGEFPTGTTKASMVSSLLESIEAVTDSALKLNYTNRLAAYIPELSEFATRAGQEIEALKVLHKDNPIMKVMRIQKQLSSKANVEKTAKEVAKLEKRLESVDTKGIIKEAIDKFTC